MTGNRIKKKIDNFDFLLKPYEKFMGYAFKFDPFFKPLNPFFSYSLFSTHATVATAVTTAVAATYTDIVIFF